MLSTECLELSIASSSNDYSSVQKYLTFNLRGENRSLKVLKILKRASISTVKLCFTNFLFSSFRSCLQYISTIKADIDTTMSAIFITMSFSSHTVTYLSTRSKFICKPGWRSFIFEPLLVFKLEDRQIHVSFWMYSLKEREMR